MSGDRLDRFVREPERARMTGVCKSAWYAMERAGAAPKRRMLGSRLIAWLESELVEWMRTRPTSKAPAPRAALRARGISFPDDFSDSTADLNLGANLSAAVNAYLHEREDEE